MIKPELGIVMKRIVCFVFLLIAIIPTGARSVTLTEARISYFAKLDSETRDIDKYFIKWAKFVFGVPPFDPSLVKIQSAIESGLNFDPNLTSPAGATGGMQIMPGTRYEIEDMFLSRLPDNAFDNRYYEADIAAGTFYNKHMWDFWVRRGEENDRMLTTLMLASYNAGAGRVSRGISVGYTWEEIRPTLPRETRDYVDTITGLYDAAVFERLSDRSYQTIRSSDIPIILASDDGGSPEPIGVETSIDDAGGPEMSLVRKRKTIGMINVFLINCGYFLTFGILTVLFVWLLFKVMDSLTTFNTSRELQNGNMAVAVFSGTVITGSIIGLCYVVSSLI